MARPGRSGCWWWPRWRCWPASSPGSGASPGAAPPVVDLAPVPGPVVRPGRADRACSTSPASPRSSSSSPCTCRTACTTARCSPASRSRRSRSARRQRRRSAAGSSTGTAVRWSRSAWPLVAVGLAGTLLALHFVPGRDAGVGDRAAAARRRDRQRPGDQPEPDAHPRRGAGRAGGQRRRGAADRSADRHRGRHRGRRRGVLRPARRTGGSWGLAFRTALLVTIGFVLIALAAAVFDVIAERRTPGDRPADHAVHTPEARAGAHRPAG